MTDLAGVVILFERSLDFHPKILLTGLVKIWKYLKKLIKILNKFVTHHLKSNFYQWDNLNQTLEGSLFFSLFLNQVENPLAN